MADAYRAWLQEQIAWHTDWCLKSAEEIGYPGMIRFADQSMRYALEAFEECLSEYDKQQPPTLPDESDAP